MYCWIGSCLRGTSNFQLPSIFSYCFLGCGWSCYGKRNSILDCRNGGYIPSEVIMTVK